MIWSGLIIGMMVGFTVQRGRFCSVALVRESVLRRPVALYSVGIILLIHTVGVHSLATMDLISIKAQAFQPIGAMIGGTLFGIGMMVASFCPATMWVRSGEGILAAWIALICLMLGVNSAKSDIFKPVFNTIRSYRMDDAFVYQTVDISPWLLVAGLALICIIWIVNTLRQPAPKPFVVPAEHTGLRRLLFETRWHPALTATLLGILIASSWYFARLSGSSTGVAFAGPSGNLLSLLATGKPSWQWGMVFVVGVMVGGFVAAWGAREFRWRTGEPKALVRAAIGGYAMGLGAAIASGCIIGHCLINASLFSWQGVVGAISIIFGASITALWLYKKQ